MRQVDARFNRVDDPVFQGRLAEQKFRLAHFMDFQADPVANPVTEVLPVTGVIDVAPGCLVNVLASCPYNSGGNPPLLSF